MDSQNLGELAKSSLPPAASEPGMATNVLPPSAPVVTPVPQNLDSKLLTVSKIKLNPEKPFDVEEFCKDIPISALSFGVRFDMDFLAEEDLSEFFAFLKASFPNQSWASLAADKSYIDISFRDQDEAKAAALKEYRFKAQNLKPIVTLCYMKQLAFVIFKDFSFHATPEDAQKQILEKIETLGIPIKVAFLEINNTQFLAPLAAAVISFSGDKLPEPLPPTHSSSQQGVSYTFKGLIEYCSACNKLGHVYCDFKPPKAEGLDSVQPPTNGHGAGDLQASPLSALKDRGTSVPLYNKGSKQNKSKQFTSQVLPLSDMYPDLPSTKLTDGTSNGTYKEIYTAQGNALALLEIKGLEYRELKEKHDALYKSYSMLLSPNLQNTLVGNPQIQPREAPKKSHSQASSGGSPNASGKRRGRPRKEPTGEERPKMAVKPSTNSLPPQDHSQDLAPKPGMGETSVFQAVTNFPVTCLPASTPAITSPATFIAPNATGVTSVATSDQPRKRGRPRKNPAEAVSNDSPKKAPRATKASKMTSAPIQFVTPAPKPTEAQMQSMTNAGSYTPNETMDASGSFSPNASMVSATFSPKASVSQEVTTQPSVTLQFSMASTPQSEAYNSLMYSAAPLSNSEAMAFSSAPVVHSDALSSMASMNPFSAAVSTVDYLSPSFMFMPQSSMDTSAMTIPLMNVGLMSVPSSQPHEFTPASQSNNQSI